MFGNNKRPCYNYMIIDINNTLCCMIWIACLVVVFLHNQIET